MAKRAAMIPSWVRDLDAMIADGVQVRVRCADCRTWRDLDLVALRAVVGGGYSLLNRRCKCRLTPGCAGWNYFMYLHGVMRPLADDATLDRWLLQNTGDRVAHHADQRQRRAKPRRTR